MQGNITFSIIIPTYNRGHLILKTLDTVFSQSYKNFEVIVIDDCSTDHTREVLEPYIAENRIIYIKNEKNRERAYSRNKGMEKATGDFVTFLDSDDYMYQDNLWDAWKAIQNNRDYKIFHNLYQLVDPSNKVLYRFPRVRSGNQVKAISQGNFLTCIGVFIHQDLYHTYRFDTDQCLKTGEDWEFWIRLLADNKIFMIPKINNGLVHHQGRSVNATTIHKTEESFHYIYQKVLNNPKLKAIYNKYLKCLKANMLWYVAYTANRQLQHETAIKYLMKAALKDYSIIFTYKFARVFLGAIFRSKDTLK